MNQHPDPVEPVNTGKIVFSINGVRVPIDAEMIPKLFVAYIAAERAEYYAGVDAARCEETEGANACFARVFREEVNHALQDRDELEDWLANNTNWASERTDGITVEYLSNESMSRREATHEAK